MDRAVSRSRFPIGEALRLEAWQVPVFDWDVWYETQMWRKVYWWQWDWADYYSHTDPVTGYVGFASWDFIILAWQYLDPVHLAKKTGWMDFSEWELEKRMMSSLSVSARCNDELDCLD